METGFKKSRTNPSCCPDGRLLTAYCTPCGFPASVSHAALSANVASNEDFVKISIMHPNSFQPFSKQTANPRIHAVFRHFHIKTVLNRFQCKPCLLLSICCQFVANLLPICCQLLSKNRTVRTKYPGGSFHFPLFITCPRYTCPPWQGTLLPRPRCSPASANSRCHSARRACRSAQSFPVSRTCPSWKEIR